MLDLLIKNGLVFDGLASVPARMDVGVSDGKVVTISRNINEPAREIVDAVDKWVTPGFVDIHTHYDLEVEIAPALSESVRHGVTTVVMGNCSLSLAIGSPQTLADIFQRVETLPSILIHKWLETSVSWNTPREYINHLSHLNLGPNVAPLFGHSALRAHVMGLERSLKCKATTEELDRMREIAEQALEAGFIGISIDMVPWHMMSGELRGRTIPSQHADFREYKMLADVCRKRDAVFQVTPNPQRRASMFDILKLSLGPPPLRITVLSALDSVADRRLWRVFRPMLFIFNDLLRCNMRFQTLTEPFTIYSDGPITPLFEEFPSGVRLNDCDTRMQREALWNDAEFRNRFRHDWTSGWRKTFHRDLELMQIVRCPDSSLEGITFAEAARRKQGEAAEVFMALLAEYDTDIRWVATGANDRVHQRLNLMSQPYILPGFTDAGAHVRNLGYYDGALSLLRQAVATGFMRPEEALARVTGEAARWFRLDAGVLCEGAKADLVLIDPQYLNEPISGQVEICDATLDDAMRMVKRGSERVIESVYIAGKLVVRKGEVMSILGNEKLGEVIRIADSAKASDAEKARQSGRNRINNSIPDHPFTDYWDIFVMKHQNPYNIALHFLGVIVFYGILAAAIFARNPWLLLFLPLSQVVGLVGHYFFERSHIDLQDAVFSIRASRCLNKMFLRIITGKYVEDINRANNELNEYLVMRGEEVKS